ncbi:MAG: Uma2 family endonuclease [Bryobacteraceae bacterium]
MVSVESYLRTSFADLDREFKYGVIEKRNPADVPHATAHMQLIVFFAAHRKMHQLRVLPGLRLRIHDQLVRIPDISVFYPDAPSDAVPSKPPFIIVEVLSLEDRMTKVRAKLEEYREWGIPHVWLVDPYERRMYCCEEGLKEVGTLRAPEIGLEMTPADIFEE